ncbi:MAG: lipoyl protein ligase domain-containing protein, partial [Sediminibacterium sp.]
MEQEVIFKDLGKNSYKEVWDQQEALLKANADIKMAFKFGNQQVNGPNTIPTLHHLLFVEHPPVYTLGKNGKEEHVLISEKDRLKKGIEYFHINRGGDITFH